MTSYGTLLPYLEAISLELPSCSLLTSDGGIFQVQSHLLSLLSPLLATLLAQAGPRPTITLPCSETLLRDLFASLLQGKGLKQSESELAFILRIQGVSQLASEEEVSDVKIYQIEGFNKEKQHVKKDNLAPINRAAWIFDTQIKIDNDETKDLIYAPSEIIHASYPCETCGKILDNKQSLKAHSEVHLIKEEKEKKSGDTAGPERALCNICSKYLANKHTLKTHMLGHTTEKKPSEEFLCSICSKSFGNKYLLKYHIDRHNGKETEKALCNLCSTWTKYLSEHMRNMHGENKHVSCSNCGSNYRISSIKKHQRLCKFTEEEREARKAAKAKNCEKCGKVLCNIFKLRKHMEICAKLVLKECRDNS